MPELFRSPLAIVDVETTGTSYKNGGVIDIGILRIEQGEVVQTMRQLINPGSPLPAFITQLTGITNDDVVDAPAFNEVAQDVYELLEDCIFVAHNVRFDYSFIKEALRRSGYQYRPKMLCTVKLSRALYPQYKSHKLDALIERFSIPMLERHRAFADAEATWKALQCMLADHDEHVINQQTKIQLRQPSLPMQLDREKIANLPETPGVYIFRSVAGAPLYVGKSINIRDRVLSHFSDDHRLPKEQRIAQEVSDIETITTTGEFGALITESRLIKELMPIYNRMLRRQSEMVVAWQDQSEDGFPTVQICRKAELWPQDLSKVVGIFRSEKQAKDSILALAKEFHLCHKLLNLQKTSGACFSHQLNVCYGACAGKESSLEYSRRFKQAFARSRIKLWPYASPILVTEQNSHGQRDGYIIDNWCLVGQLVQRDQLVEFQPVTPSFDLDRYKIMKRFVANRQSQKYITSIGYSQLETMGNKEFLDMPASESF